MPRVGQSRPGHPLQQHWSSLQRRLRSCFAIPPHQASFAARGFPCSNPESRDRLERVGKTFLAGFNCALIEDEPGAVRASVARVDPDHRGYAIEGAAMGSAIADAISGGDRLRGWIVANEAHYTYLVHVGVGWALARVPWRRAAIRQHLDPIHHWLVFEGAGFHRAYFRPGGVLDGGRSWRRGYAARAYDQGIGRALYFVAGGHVDRAIAMLRSLAPSRHDDLWSGFGLALAYAGGARPSDLRSAVAAAGALRPSLLQGAAFAAEAHCRAHHVPAHTTETVRALTGHDAEPLSRLVREVRARLSPLDGTPDAPAYEIWRRTVQRALCNG
jgi:hypothetical protein